MKKPLGRSSDHPKGPHNESPSNHRAPIKGSCGRRRPCHGRGCGAVAARRRQKNLPHGSVSAGTGRLCLQSQTHKGGFRSLCVQKCRQRRTAPAETEKCPRPSERGHAEKATDPCPRLPSPAADMWRTANAVQMHMASALRVQWCEIVLAP